MRLFSISFIDFKISSLFLVKLSIFSCMFCCGSSAKTTEISIKKNTISIPIEYQWIFIRTDGTFMRIPLSKQKSLESLRDIFYQPSVLTKIITVINKQRKKDKLLKLMSEDINSYSKSNLIHEIVDNCSNNLNSFWNKVLERVKIDKKKSLTFTQTEPGHFIIKIRM